MTSQEKDLGEEGFTLVEMLVAMVVVFMLLGATMSVLVTSTGIVKTISQLQNVNEEARLALNRMARDLRQATSVVTAVNPDGPGFNSTRLVGIRVRADFDGDGCIGGVALVGPPTSCLSYNSSNPEDISYCYEPWNKQLYVIDNQETPPVVPLSPSSINCPGGQLLAGNLTALTIEYRSNSYRHDVNPSDGVTTWRELDQAASPVGNANGLLDTELATIDSVVVDLTVTVDSRSQTYRTQVDLRNAS